MQRAAREHARTPRMRPGRQARQTTDAAAMPRPGCPNAAAQAGGPGTLAEHPRQRRSAWRDPGLAAIAPARTLCQGVARSGPADPAGRGRPGRERT